MDASYVCERSIFELISKLAALLLQDERAHTEQTDANNAFVPKPVEVSKKRTELYESLLYIRTYQLCPHLDRFPKCRKLLDEERSHFDEQLIKDITYCVVKVSKSPNIISALSKYFQNHTSVRTKCKLLRPKPLGLEVAPRNWKSQDSFFTTPKIFQSIKDLNGQLEKVTFAKKTNIVLSDINSLKQIVNTAVSQPKFKSSTLKESLSRMREFTLNTEPLKTRFPTFPKQKEEPINEEHRKDDQQKGEPKKADPKRGEHTKGERRRGEPRRAEPKRDESKKGEPNKADPEKGEPEKGERKRGEPKREESKRRDPKKDEPEKGESNKGEPKKEEHTRGDHRRGEHKGEEHKRHKHRKAEHNREEHKKGEHKKAEHKKGEHKKSEHKKGEHKKSEHKKCEPKKAEPRKAQPEEAETRKPDKNGKFRDKHFFSDVCMTNEIKCLENDQIELSFIELPNFIDHLKKASVGLQSESFLWTSKRHFQLRPNSTIKTVLPEVLAEYSQPFLDSGCAFRRLTAHTEWHYDDNRIESPMNRTMRQAIMEFLTNSRLFLLSQPATTLSQLLYSSGPIMQMVMQLDQMFRTERYLDTRHGTSGAILLKVIWSAIDSCVNIQYLQFLMYLLKSVCETYCGQLQRWLYHGVLDESFNELFMCAQRCLDAQSKEFFDKGFFVRSHLVPGFLTGYESAIVQCGKYSRMLKSYNPQHIIFNTKHPDLTVCLSQEQLLEMQQKFELHYKQLLQHTNPFRMQSVIEENSASRFRFGNRMWSCTQERIADWKSNQRELLLRANEDKLRRYEEINNQLKEQEQLRLEHRRMEIASELAFQQKFNEQDEERLRRDKQILEERIAEYQNYINPRRIAVVGSSPDESTNSSHSFISCCEELEPKLQQAQKQSDEQNANNTEEAADKSPTNEAPQEPNANDADMEMERNRNRNMCSEQFQECQTEVKLMETNTTTHALTDLECNRLRVLGCTDMQPQLPPDVNMNLEDLSDMQRNRQRMQQHEHFGTINDTKQSSKSLEIQSKTKDNLAKPVELRVDLRLPLEPNKLFVEPAMDTATPMSTTSDVEIETFIANETVDAVNNNVTENPNAKELFRKPALEVPKRPIFQLRKPPLQSPTFKLQRNEGVAASHNQQQECSNHNAFLIKRYVQQSIMMPLKSHLSLLRNEVLRVFDDLNVYEHFLQLRNYFFLLDGEFGTLLIGGILQRIESGMEPKRLCKSGTLDVILNNALGNRASDGLDSTAALIAENLKLTFTNAPDSFDLMDVNLLSIFSLTYKVDWPLNLVISSETIAKYSQIFTHLLKLRQVNFMLERAYEHLQQLGKLHGKPLQSSPQYRHLQMIRQKLSHFVITLQNHLDTNALQGSWETFNERLRSVDSVEELYQRHVEYLKHIAFISLLNRRSAKFREMVDNILVVVLRFCKILQSKPFELNKNQEFVHPRYKRLVFEETEFEKFLHYIIYLGEKIDASGYQDKIVELIRVINFNSFYKVTYSSNQAK